jgi:hypothetical protein
MVNELAGRLFDEVDSKSKEMASLHKALKSLASPKTLESPRKVQDACRVLEQLDPRALGLDMDFAGLIEAAAADQQARLKARKIEFGRMLIESAEQGDAACRMIASDPMEFAIPPFTISVDLDQNIARIHYARLVLEDLPARPDRIMAALQKNLKVLEGGWSSDQFFDALHTAYQNALFEKLEHLGERVSLTELLPRLALSFQSDRFRSDPVAGHYRGYGRARLAYDLSRLRREKLVQRNGWRLNLGTATGSSTRDKKGVLYIEESPGQGQYYLSIWFTTVV